MFDISTLCYQSNLVDNFIVQCNDVFIVFCTTFGLFSIYEIKLQRTRMDEAKHNTIV